MCRIVYLVADRPLRVIRSGPSCLAPRQGEDALPAFEVEAFDGSEKERVCAIAGGDYVYLAHSFQGCGCGFYYESNSEFEAGLDGAPPDVRQTCAQYREAGMASVAGLASYLSDVVRDRPVVVYVAYAGAEGRRPLAREQRVSPSYFGGDEFCLREDEIYEVAELP